MTSKETLKIAFTTGGILPASIMSAEKDQRVAARVPCDVPVDYANQLIADKFAYLYEDNDAAQAEKDAAEKKAAEEAAAKAKADQDAADKKAAEEAAAKAKADEEAAAAAKAAADANGQNKA